MAYFSITELQDIDVVGLELLRCLTHGNHNFINPKCQHKLALLVMGKAFHIDRDVGHMIVNFRHPFDLVI